MGGSTLQFLTIYNPDLDPSEENVADQILFYYSSTESTEDDKLRHVGLMQGVLELSRVFADGRPLDHLETAMSRIIVTQLEPNQNWWIAASIELAESGSLGSSSSNPGSNTPSPDPISLPDALISDLKCAYHRWKLHHGSLQSYLHETSREQLVQDLEPWWTVFCCNWDTSLNSAGAKACFSDKTLIGKGQLKEPTIDAIQAIMSKELDLLDLVIVMNGAEKIEYDGCIWKGQGHLSPDSVTELVQWISECASCGKNASNAFLEKSGYVHHLKSSVDDQVEKTPITSGEDRTAVVPFIKGAFSSVAQASQSAFGQVIGLSSKISFHPFSGTSTPEPKGELKDSAPPDDLTESQFLVGLSGRLLEDAEDEDGGEEESNGVISYKKLFLTFNSIEQPVLRLCNTVIYYRQPFIFALIYEEDSESLNAESYYQALHLRLASITEPIYGDLNSLTSNSDKLPKFYYLVVDPTSNTVQSSIPQIPPPLSSEKYLHDDQTTLEKYIFDREEIMHVHQSIGALISNTFGYEQEKFIRTSRNWWVYWSKLNDERIVIFARKWSRHQRSQPNTNGMLSALGHDTRAWLDDYKYYGRV